MWPWAQFESCFGNSLVMHQNRWGGDGAGRQSNLSAGKVFLSQSNLALQEYIEDLLYEERGHSKKIVAIINNIINNI